MFPQLVPETHMRHGLTNIPSVNKFSCTGSYGPRQHSRASRSSKQLTTSCCCVERQQQHHSHPAPCSSHSTISSGPLQPHKHSSRLSRAPRAVGSPAVGSTDSHEDLEPAAAAADGDAADAASAEEDAADAADAAAYALSDEPGPAFRGTLEMLEWRRLCQHLAKFSSTSIGKRLCLQLSVPLQEATSLRLQQEVSAVYALENTFTTLLDFGGINSGDAEGAIKRADKGGMVAAKQLRGLVTLLEGADRLKRQVALVARQNRVTGRDSPLRPLLDATGAVSVPTALMRAITAAIQEDGEIADSASEQVRTTRQRVRALTSRINNMLKGYPGEPSEKGGRLCIAAPAGTKVTNGVLLGTSVGGGMVYIEPGTVVALNNELMSARAEALSAEEAVLWDLSARLMGVLEDVQLAFDTVGWLDLTAAKVRFGLWLGGIMPTFTPWEEVFGRRPAGAPFGTPTAAAAGFVRPAVSLQRLSHPLLLADFKAKKQRLEHVVQLNSTAAAAASSKKKGAERMLGTRKEVMARRLSSSEAAALLAGMEQEDKEAGSGGLSPEQELAQLQPPKPIDITIQPETAVVVITGPNTGGKTATMKALGLAACMAKTGMMLPAAAPARLPCFSSVLADIGDEQSLTANLSTFSGHIKRISAVRSEADGWSLLLLDELGTGTDPTEGAALGQALLKALVRGGPGNGALTIATTHHSTMTGLKFEDGRVENASVEFDEEKLAPTYKLLWGVPGRSNALNIASRLGLSADIIQAARQRLAAGVAAANAAIEELEEIQEEVRQADMLLFAVNANVQNEKAKVLDAKEVNARRQKELAVKRVAAVQSVLDGARPLLKALKEERKQRMKKGNTQTKLTRMLDTALGESTNKPSGKSLESALQVFETLTSSSSSRAAAARQQQQEQQQLLQAAEPWVQTWVQLLSSARATLAREVLTGGSSSSVNGGSSSGSRGSRGSNDSDVGFLEEIEQLRQQQAAAAAAKQASLRAAQQLVENFLPAAGDQHQQQEGGGVGGHESDIEGENEEQVLSRKEQKRQKAARYRQEIEQEAIAEGVRVLEEALDEDLDLWALQEEQGRVLQQQAEEEKLLRQQAAEAEAAELAALEQQFDLQFELLLEEEQALAAAAAEAAKQEEQQQKQAAEAAAAAARQQQEQQQQAEEQRQRQQQQADLQMLKAFEELTDLDAFDLNAAVAQVKPAAKPSSSSSSGSRSGSSNSSGSSRGGSSKAAASNPQPSVVDSSSSSSSSGSSSSSSVRPAGGTTKATPPPAAEAAGQAAAAARKPPDLYQGFDAAAALDDLLDELGSFEDSFQLSGGQDKHSGKQGQQQQQQQGKQAKAAKAKPLFKFKKS